MLLGLVLGALLNTESSLLPRLDRSFCTAESVVVASVVQIEMREGDSDPAFVRMLVTNWIKGDLPEGLCFRVKGNTGYQMDGSYLMFLGVTAEALTEYSAVRLSEACGAEATGPLLTAILSVVVTRKEMVQLDPGYVVLPSALIPVEEALALRDRHEQVMFPLAEVKRFFATLGKNECHELAD